MVAAISLDQWRALIGATGTVDGVAALERDRGADLGREGERYRHREEIAALLAPWFAARTLDEARPVLDEHGVCWGPYQTFTQLLDDDWRASAKNPVFASVEHPGIGPLLTPASPIRTPTDPPVAPAAAPRLGEHSDEVLAGVLGLSDAEIGALHDEGIVAGPAPR
jgi:2-methylfumaryl-CoA isomerase